jgi:histidinol-phosphate phosphatase family protein
MTNRAVFLDRDGTMAKDVSYCRRWEDFILFPYTAKAIKLLKEQGFKVIVVTNQSGIARGYFTEETLTQIHDKLQKELAKENASVDAIYYCPHHPDDNCDCRKPKPRMVLQAAEEHDIDLSQSFVVGDLPTDVGLGKSAGCRTVLVGDSASHEDSDIKPNVTVSNLWEAAQAILEWRE